MEEGEREEREDNNPDTGYSSCEDKAETEVRYNISFPPEEQRTGKAEKSFQNNYSGLLQYPIKNLVQGTNSSQAERGRQRERSPSSSSSGPREVTEGLAVTEGWHGPVRQRTRAVPVKYYGRLQVPVSSDGQQAGQDQFFRRDGWTEIPIQRI